MTEQEIRKLESTENWDFENAAVVKPQRKIRAVVSVAFSPEALDQVAEHAKALDIKLSTYIREAAIEKATGGIEIQLSGWTGGAPGGLFFITADPSSTTRGTLSVPDSPPVVVT